MRLKWVTLKNYLRIVLYKTKRSNSVEPVFGTLTQFMEPRKINTMVSKQTSKVMHMIAMVSLKNS